MMKTIIFDFDNVIGMSEQSRFQIVQQAAKKYNIVIHNSLFKEKIGKTAHTFLTQILKKTEKHALEKIIADYEKEFRANLTIYVKPSRILIDFIKNNKKKFTFGLASMSARQDVERFINHHGIYESFAAILCKEDVTHQKPHPEVYTKSAQLLSVSSSECLVIEDSVVGAQSALSAGMKCYIYLNGFNRKEEFLDLPINGFINSKKDLNNLI